MSYYTTTYSGKRLSFTNPQSDQICLDDIFQALPQLCRFSGNTKYFYSVAQHSLNCYYVAKNFYQANIETQLACLLHDAAETYISDIPSDLKGYVDEKTDDMIWEIEENIISCIYDKIFPEYRQRHKILNNISKEIITLVDQRMLLTEYDLLIGGYRGDWALSNMPNLAEIDVEKIPILIGNYQISFIRKQFINVFNSLVDKMKVKYG